MKRVVCCFGLVALSAMLVACSSLKSPHYVGERVTFQEDAVGSESVWKIEEEIYHVKIVNSNEVVGSLIEWNDEKKAHVPKSFELVVSKLGQHLFFNVMDGGLYNVHRVAMGGDDSVIFYMLDAEAIKKHEPSGRVEPDKDGNVFTLKGSKAEIDRFVLEHIRSLFNPDEVVVARLVSGDVLKGLLTEKGEDSGK